MSAFIPPTRLTGPMIDRSLGNVAPHWRPVLLGVRDAGLAFCSVIQNRRPFDLSDDRPTVLLLGDDLEASHGPGGFHRKSVQRFVERCSLAVVVACAPDVRLYGAAADAAKLTRGRTVIVETQPQHEADWIHRLRAIKPGIPLLVGSVRPASAARH